jgi:hypothetical protein
MKWKLQYGHLLPKAVITIPWKVLCVDFIGPYTLNSKAGTLIDFMALKIIGPVLSILLSRQTKTKSGASYVH